MGDRFRHNDFRQINALEIPGLTPGASSVAMPAGTLNWGPCFPNRVGFIGPALSGSIGLEKRP